MTREEFKKALIESASKEFENIPNDAAEDYVFSDRFERRMNKLISQTDNRRRKISTLKTFGKFAAVAAASILLTATTTVHLLSKDRTYININGVPYNTTGPLQMTLSNSYVNDSDELCTELKFTGSTYDTIEHEYDFAYLPAGYSWAKTELTPRNIKREYVTGSRDNKKTIYFHQSSSAGTSTYTNYTVRTLDINGLEIILLNDHIAVWVQDNYKFKVQFPSSTSDYEIIKTIESLTLVE